MCDSKYWLQRAILVGPPDILVSSLVCTSKCFSANVLQCASIDDSLEIPVLDEVRMEWNLLRSFISWTLIEFHGMYVQC